MKRLSIPIWVTSIILGGLLLSIVLAQTGGYTISAFVVAGGGFAGVRPSVTVPTGPDAQSRREGVNFVGGWV